MMLNKIILYMILYSITLFSNIEAYHLLTKKQKKSNTLHILLLLTLSFLIFSANRYDSVVTQIIIYFLAKYFVLYLYYHDDTYPTFFYTFIFGLIESSVIMILLLLLQSTIDKGILQMILQGCIPLLAYASYHTKLVSSYLNNMYQNAENLYYRTEVFALMLVGVILLATLGSINMDMMGAQYIVIVITIVICALTVAVFALYHARKTLKTINKNLLESNEAFMNIAEDYATLKHNMINQLLAIRSVANRKAQLLIDEKIEEYEQKYRTTKGVYKIPKGLQGIIYQKIYQITEKDLTVNVVNNLKKDPFQTMSPRKYNNLCECVGILLDNAIEATLEAENKMIHIEFEEDNRFIKISIVNTFHGILDIEAFGTRNYTSKKSGHGIGVNYILKSKLYRVNYQIINNLCYAELRIKK